MDPPKLLLLKKSHSNHSPFAQPSPPPRRNPSQPNQSVHHLISPPILRPPLPPPPPQQPQPQQQQLKKRKLSQSKHLTTKPRSRIPFQWRLPSTTSNQTLPNSSSTSTTSPRSSSNLSPSSNSNHSIQQPPRPNRSSSPPPTSHSSSSSSLHPSLNYPTDSEFESLSDDHEEVLSPNSSQPTTTHLTTPSNHHNQSTHPTPTQPSNPSSPPHQNHSSQPLNELPFACPSPNRPNHRLAKTHPRLTPAQAPPLPRSRTPSLVIRPKLASIIQPSSQSSSDTHSHNSTLDHPNPQHRPKSSVIMRGLGWGRAPIDPPRLISPSYTSSIHNPSSSDLSIDHPLQDLTTIDHLSLPPISNQPTQETPLPNRTRTFKDRFTLASTAPLRLSKRPHLRSQTTAPGTGHRIVSSLFGVRSPPTHQPHHTLIHPDHEKRKLEFKRLISYPVLNHSTSGHLNHPSDLDHQNFHQGASESDSYNLNIEAAMRSLEGIKTNNNNTQTDSITTTPSQSIKSGSNTPEERPISWTFEDKPDLSDLEASFEFSFTSGKSDAWAQKLRRRVSVNRLMIKSRNKHPSSPSPDRHTKTSPDSRLRQYKLTQKQLRSKASARFRPLIRKVSSVSNSQRTPIGASEGRMAFEAHELERPGEDNDEKELLSSAQTPIRRANPERLINFKLDSRLRQIRSSNSRGHTPRSTSSPTVSLTTPQQSKPFPRSSQSIREKRKIFERAVNPSIDSSPHRLTNSSLAISIASSSHSTSRGALSTSSGLDRRSSVPSERPLSQRKPTPAEIKLRDESQSVKALVDKFETQHHHNSLGRSIESGSQKNNSSKAARSSGTGVIRTSLLSLWSGGDRSSMSSRRVVSRRLSRQLILDHRRKASGRSSTESGSKAESRPIRKLKKKPKRTLRNSDDSSSSSFGCTFDEQDEYTHELEDDPHIDLSLPVKLPGSSDVSNRHLSMLLPKSSIQQKRSTWSVRNSSPRPSTAKSKKQRADLKLQAIKSRLGSLNTYGSDCNSPESDDHESKPISHKPSMDCVESDHHRACSPLSSEQVHQAQTVLEPQTVWMGDGSQRTILVAGGCLQVAKKIPFPSFEDDVEFSQNILILQQQQQQQQPPPAGSPPSSKLIAKSPNQRISTFLRTRKFDNELEEDEDELASSRGCSTRTTSLCQNQERGMLSPVGIASLQDSPTLGRGRRSWQRPMVVHSSSRSSSTGRPYSTPSLLLVAPSDVPDKDDTNSSSSGIGTRNSLEIQQMYLGVQRCEGLGNKMFGSSINIHQHVQESPVSRRATSAIISTSTARLFLPLSPTGSCPSPSSPPPFRVEYPQSITASPKHELQSSSPPVLTSTSSALLKCERVDQFKEDDLTDMTDKLDSNEETPPQDRDLQQKHEKPRGSSAPTKARRSSTDDTSKLFRRVDDFEISAIHEIADKALRQEIARLERVRAKWLKLCLEVEDVLKKSRERWPDRDRSIKVLKDFVNPNTRSSIDTFLEKSRQLYKESSGLPFTANQADQQSASRNQVHDLTPPPRHPFGRQSIVSASAGNLRQRTHGRQSLTGSRQSFITPSKLKGANKLQASKGFPLLITLPVPSAFVSPERFRGCAKAPQSEHAPRISKISNSSRCSAPRQHTLSNRLGSPSIKLMNTCDRRARMMSGTSSSNVSISSNGKVILGERSVNQLPDRNLITGEKKPANFSPKLSGNNTLMSPKTAGSLGRATRPSTGKWGSENEAPLWTSVSVRETRKPWRRSILNQEVLPREPRLSLADSATGSVSSATEEVGVLVAAGEQPTEFSTGFHVSGSLRLKHRRRLNQIRNE